MSISQLSLITDALLACGENPPSAADDGSQEWRCTSAGYDIGLRRLLADHNWKFALTIEAVEDRSDPDDPIWADAYARPTNLVHITRIMDVDGGAITDYRIVGNKIYVNDDEGILVEGVEDKEPSEWPNYFADVMTHYLFAGIYRGLKKSPVDARNEEIIADKLLARARPRLDAEEPVRARHVSGLKAARSVRRG